MEAIVTHLIGERTAAVNVEKTFSHKKYSKVLRYTRKFLVHVPEGVVVAKNDAVVISPSRPISKLKKFVITEVKKVK